MPMPGHPPRVGDSVGNLGCFSFIIFTLTRHQTEDGD